MTIDNTTPIDGLSNEDGTPMTRGDLLALQQVDLHAIRDQVAAAITAYDAGDVTPPELRAAVMAFAQHLVGYTASVAGRLVEHDMAQMYAQPMPTTITVPDHLPEDFA